MTLTYCDRCRAEGPVYEIDNPLAQEGPQLGYEDIREAHYPLECVERYSDDDGVFRFKVELCQSCRIELARKLIAFMEAHKS